MKKYIIVGVVIVIGIILILFLVKDKRSVTPETLAPLANTNTINQPSDTKPITNLNNTKAMTNATLHTNMGDIKIEFYETAAPKTVENFIKLTQSKFYDGVKFHRVIKGFMIQGGDPLSKDDSKVSLWGTGGPGYSFADEINVQSDLYKIGYKKGIVAMANSGPNTNGSQFFIMTTDYPLPPLYTIFGKVVSGQDVIDKIALVKTGPNDRPVQAVVINSISLQ